MFIRRALTLVVAVLWLWPAAAQGQSEALDAAYRQGQALYEAGQYEQALPQTRPSLIVEHNERVY